ncbi:hypothetical protein ACX80S_06845 [Arthrobacter sp. RHLT1-20]
MATMPACAPGVQTRHEDEDADDYQHKPQPDDAAGVGMRPELRDSGGGQNQRHGKRKDAYPGLQRAQLQHHRQEQWDCKEHARLHEELSEKYAKPAGETLVPEQPGIDQRIAAH